MGVVGEEKEKEEEGEGEDSQGAESVEKEDKEVEVEMEVGVKGANSHVKGGDTKKKSVIAVLVPLFDSTVQLKQVHDQLTEENLLIDWSLFPPDQIMIHLLGQKMMFEIDLKKVGQPKNDVHALVVKEILN